MNTKELNERLLKEVKNRGIKVNKENLSKLFKDKSLKQLDNMISDLMEASSPNDDVMRLDTIMIIQEIVKDRKNILKGECIE